jgi:hypothetical protein
MGPDFGPHLRSHTGNLEMRARSALIAGTLFGMLLALIGGRNIATMEFSFR